MKNFHALLLACILPACAAPGRGNGVVIPYEDGRFVATASARAEQDALRDALAAAKDECGGRRQQLAVLKQKTEYRGVVAREVVKTAEQLEEILAAEGGRIIPDLSSDEDYKVSIDFRCSSDR